MGRFVVGIDLGTTHTAVASARAGGGDVETLAIDQLVSATEVQALDLLPSFLYAPLEAEKVGDPFGDGTWTIGAFARKRGAEVPSRLVSSSKSWLCHPRVDRTAAILPWASDDDAAPKISPLDAATRILKHVAGAWNRARPSDALADQTIVLTVPASFDEAARELTALAAERAGLRVRLLEEPQAAFYDFMRRAGDDGLRDLASRVGDGLVLVCDVGGGTTDLSLLRVTMEGGVAKATRVAVGRRLLLGGDNMDLALAHAMEKHFVAEGESLEPSRFASLVFMCRGAKEKLLARDAPDEAPVTLLARGSKLLGGTKTARLDRATCERVVLEGFFPIVQRGERAGARGGLVAFGLPYERDVAITRHVGEFLERHAKEGSPRAILFNGGVFHAERIAARVAEAVSSWSGHDIETLPFVDPDRAVARGAVAYALALEGKGARIESGAAVGTYVGIEAKGSARRAVCVLPRGAKEGEKAIAKGLPLALVVGRPVRFELFTSDDASHAPGEIVEVGEGFDRLPSVVAAFAAGEKPREVKVELEGELSAIGTLDLACVEIGGEGKRYELAIDLREAVQPSDGDAPRRSSLPPPSESKSLAAALDMIDRVFGKPRPDAHARDVKDLPRELDRVLGPRERWIVPTLRALADALIDRAKGRKRSLDHERVFWQLAGFSMRPGFGDPLDPERGKKLAPLFFERLAFGDEARGWQAFWIAWRRCAGALDEAAQTSIRDVIDPLLAPSEKRMKKPKGWKSEAESDLLDFASTLERVQKERRGELGSWILERTWTSKEPRLWAAIGRIGAREPAYASVHHVVSPLTAERFLDHLLREKWSEVPSAPLAAMQMARVTGDRARDVAERVRLEVARRLENAQAPEAFARAVRELVASSDADRAAFFGESLPLGLRLAEA